MIRRILTAGVLIPIVLAALFRGPLWSFLLLGSVFLGAAIWEFLSIAPRYQAGPLLLSYPLILGLPWIWNYQAGLRMPYVVLSVLLLMTGGLASRGEPRMKFLSSALSVLGFFYLGFPFALIGEFHPGSGASGYELVLVLVAVWICDSAAFFAGRYLGRHRITPNISPGKTLEGFVAGTLAATVFVAGAGTRYLSWPLFPALGLGLVLPLAAISGDLFESAIKRGAGIKDSSHLVPGHGGVLDRIDSLLFAIPCYFVVNSIWSG